VATAGNYHVCFHVLYALSSGKKLSLSFSSISPRKMFGFAQNFWGVSVYIPPFAGTHCAYPRRDGQAELTWVAGLVHTEMVYSSADGHPSKYWPCPALINFVDATNNVTNDTFVCVCM